MQRQEKLKIWYTLYGRLLDVGALEKAFKKVKTAKGAPGIDGQSIKVFAEDLLRNLTCLVDELKEKSYRPLPVKRVEIPKPDGGVRKLGIPAVRDRVVQQVLLDILTPIYDPYFHPSSYGYRPGKGCHHAITKASNFMRKYELDWVVDMDLSKCFDTLKHDFLMRQIRKRVVDGSILNLISLFLKSGAMVGNELIETQEGSPQGGVISPLLANIYLDYFDQWTMSRGYRIVRYADDILIFASSRKGAERRLKEASKVLEEEMGLVINQEKTSITSLNEGVSYLGVVIHPAYTRIQGKKLRIFKAKVKAATRRSVPVNLTKIIKDLNPLIRGFANYFRIANCTGVFRTLMSWIRRRLRAIQLKQWKKPAKLHRRLRQLGYKGDFKKIKMSSWCSARSPLASLAMPNLYFTDLGLFNMELVRTGHSVPVI
jgi:RNA-directed DNA polymerase